VPGLPIMKITATKPLKQSWRGNWILLLTSAGMKTLTKYPCIKTYVARGIMINRNKPPIMRKQTMVGGIYCETKNIIIMNETTLEKMKSLKFYGMVRAFTSSLEDGRMSTMTADEMISFLTSSDWDDRNNRRIERYIRNAKFRYNASIEKLYLGPERNLEKNQVMRFAECGFIDKSENILITGCTGIGKSYIASALGNQACLMGYKVFYMNITKLFAKLKMLKADGSYLREISRIEKQDLLILDDFGLQPLDNHNRLALMELIEDRHGKRSTIITSQLPVKEWYDVIGEKTIADAIMDRLVHDAHRLEITGESMRRNKKARNQMMNN